MKHTGREKGVKAQKQREKSAKGKRTKKGKKEKGEEDTWPGERRGKMTDEGCETGEGLGEYGQEEHKVL